MKRLGIAILLLSVSFIGQADPSQNAVASAHPYATEAGMLMLKKGGNAFDAAIAVASTLAVVEPYSSGIGGGGFFLLHDSQQKKNIFLDAREKAPLKGHRDMYLNDKGEVVPNLSITGAMAAGIPGIPAAFVHLNEKYGKLPLSETLAPAIAYAEKGFPVDRVLKERIEKRLEDLKTFPSTAKIFLKADQVPELGDRMIQKDLANTLRQIAGKGREGFYQGEVAKHLVDAVQAAGGIWSLDDLKAYQAVERQPLEGEYKGMKIISAPPPSSGGAILIEILNILERDELTKLAKIERAHLLVEAMRRAYRDRAEYLGDTDFIEVPLANLTSQKYADELRATIDSDKATLSSSLKGVAPIQSGQHTTHFSILDENGNRVSATLSINTSFGSAFVPEGTGVVLNNEMDDFSIKPGVPNAYGLVGAEANAIEPGKRPLSSMTPTFVEKDKAVAILGTPGGSRIISMVLLGALEFAAGKDPAEWVSVPRFHHQYLPDAIQFEPEAFNAKDQMALQALGHRLKPLEKAYGNMHAILVSNKGVKAASDPRGIGCALVEGEGLACAVGH